MPYNFEDDVIFDEFVDRHFDDLLEDECASVLARLCSSAEALVGDAPVWALLRTSAEIVHASVYASPAEDLEGEFKLGGSYREAASAVARLGNVDVSGVPLQLKSYNLKMYAMLGTVDRSAGEPSDVRGFIEEVVGWARQLADTVADEATEPFLCFFAKAASARLDLDLGRNPAIDEFAALAGLARHPHSEPLTHEVLSLPLKTIQNLISARTLDRIGDDKLSHKSAHAWMKKQWAHDILYPSRAFAASAPADNELSYDEPVFVPVIAEARNILAEPYLPEQRHEDGYRLQLPDGERTLANYWEALTILRSNPSAKVSTPHFSQYLPLSKDWRIFEKAVLDEMVANEAPAAGANPYGESKGLCSQVLRLAERHPQISLHRIGHTKKLCRYKCSNGEELAIEKRPDRPLLYVAASPRNEQRFGSRAIRRKGPGPEGRNSNLNAMDAFVDRPLLVLRPDTLEEARATLDLLTER